jgi:lipid-binding SYLF domain-containing protein
MRAKADEAAECLENGKAVLIISNQDEAEFCIRGMDGGGVLHQGYGWPYSS